VSSVVWLLWHIYCLIVVFGSTWTAHLQLSGTTLALTFLCLCFFPVAFLSSIGLASALALTSTIAAGLTLTPAMLLCFDSFFVVVGPPLCCGKGSAASALSELVTDARPTVVITPTANAHDHEAGQFHTPASFSGDADADTGAESPTCWFRIGRCTTTPVVSISIIIVFLVVSGLLSDRVLHMATTVANNLIFPRNAPSYETLQQLNHMFSPGVLSPYTIAASTSLSAPPATILTDVYFRTANSLIADLLALTPSLSIMRYLDSSAGLLPGIFWLAGT
jgi:uncharacterized membrane protein YdfJ with MMPL/SSD domain